jgi:flavodoxin
LKVVIIYDSFFGNTKEVALTIGQSLETENSVKILSVSEGNLKDLLDMDILVVGSPTRAFRPTKPLVTFLKSIPNESLKGKKAACFDTRISLKDADSRLLNVLVKFFGYAAEPMSKILLKKGASLLKEPEGFLVNESEGPLKDGEKERALRWLK